MQLVMTGQQVTMSSIDLLSLINTERVNFGEAEVRRNDFHARLRDELEGDNYESFVVTNLNGTQSEAYGLTIQQCMYVAMRESKGVRRKVQEILESKSKNPAELSRMEILQIAMEAEQGRIEAEKQLAIAKPKADFADKYMESTSGSLGLREVCKVLGAKQPEFVDFLIASGFMYRTGPKNPLTPKAEHIHNGRFEARTGTAEHGDNSHAYVQYKFTPKGVNWIAGEWGKNQVRELF